MAKINIKLRIISKINRNIIIGNMGKLFIEEVVEKVGLVLRTTTPLQNKNNFQLVPLLALFAAAGLRLMPSVTNIINGL